MINRIKKTGLVLFCIVAVSFAGCLPENSLEWSEDGSVGLLRVAGALFLVDGQTGSLAEIAPENVQPWPDISRDASLIVYSRKVDVNDLSQGFKLLPEGQNKMIEYYGKQMREDIAAAGGLANDRFPEPAAETLKADDVKNWVIRYACENADEKLIKVLGEKGIKLAREKTLFLYEVLAVSRDNLGNKRVIASSIFPITVVRLSPDKKHTAYAMNVQYAGDEMEFSLYVASIENDINNALVDQCVALGYDWSADSRRIAYLSADSPDFKKDLVLGSLDETEVADANGALLCRKQELPEEGTVQTYSFSTGSELAGTVFYPWMKVRYETGGRIFFSTVKMSLPTSNMNEPGYSMFCYDPVTGSITDVMPPAASAYASQSMNMLQFELSPDGKNVIVPISENRFLEFKLGSDELKLPLSENEGFGEEDVSQLLPAFKGNNEISFLVPGKSHFLAESSRGADKTERDEIIILDTQTGKSRILSESWPDEIMKALSE